MIDCHPLPSRPRYIPPVRRLRGTKALGISYEKKVGVYLSRLFPDLHSGQWFEFHEDGKPGCCQMDHFVVFPSQVLLVECKLKERASAWDQIARYRRVLGVYFSRPVTGVQACKILSSGRRPILDIRKALTRPGGDFLWHHLA